MITVSLRPAPVTPALTVLYGLSMKDASILTPKVPLVRAMDTAVAIPVDLVLGVTTHGCHKEALSW